MIKKETQTTLIETNNNTTIKDLNRGIQRDTRNYLFILEKFYLDFSETGISITTFINKTDISENTISRVIQKLLKKGYIKLIARNVGPTKRRKYYKISEEGANYWENSRN